MDTTSRALEITVISGEDLHINRSIPVRKNAFVIVKTDSQNVKSTKIDVEGGSYPAWNEKLVVQMPMHVFFFTVEVQCKVSTSNCKVIGRARIPVSDFTGGCFPENYLHFLSYKLRDGNGESNGIINISVKTKVNGGCGGGAAADYSHYLTSWMSPPVDEIVTGIPVWNRGKV